MRNCRATRTAVRPRLTAAHGQLACPIACFRRLRPKPGLISWHPCALARESACMRQQGRCCPNMVFQVRRPKPRLVCLPRLVHVALMPLLPPLSLSLSLLLSPSAPLLPPPPSLVPSLPHAGMRYGVLLSGQVLKLPMAEMEHALLESLRELCACQQRLNLRAFGFPADARCLSDTTLSDCPAPLPASNSHQTAPA